MTTLHHIRQNWFTTRNHLAGNFYLVHLTYHSAPTDYHFFASIGHALVELRFGFYEDVKKWLDEWFTAKRKIFYWRGIHKLPERWRKCTISDGAHFEQSTFYHSPKFNAFFLKFAFHTCTLTKYHNLQRASTIPLLKHENETVELKASKNKSLPCSVRFYATYSFRSSRRHDNSAWHR